MLLAYPALVSRGVRVQSMKYRMRDAEPPLSSRDMQKLQKALGKPLPEGLKWFYRQWNGGCPEPNAIPVRVADEMWLGFVEVYGTTGEFPITVANEYASDWCPKDLLVFASDGIGSSFLVGIAGKRLEKVYFVDEELNERDTCHFIANSIPELLERLVDQEELINASQTLQSNAKAKKSKKKVSKRRLTDD